MNCNVCERDTSRRLWELTINRAVMDESGEEMDVHWSGQMLVMCGPCADRIGLLEGLSAAVEQTIEEASEDCPPVDELPEITTCPNEEPDGLCPECDPTAILP